MPKRATPDSSQSAPPPLKRSSSAGIMDNKASKAVATSSGGSRLDSDTRYFSNEDSIHATGADSQMFFQEEKYSVMGNSTSNMARASVPIRYKTPERSQPVQGLPSPVSPTPPDRLLRPSDSTSRSSYPPGPATPDVEMTGSPASLVYPPTPCPNRSSPPFNDAQPASSIVPAPRLEEPFDFVKSREVLLSVKSSRNRMNEHVRMLEEEFSSALNAEHDRQYTAICEMKKEHHELEYQVQHLQARKLEIEREAKSLSESNKAAKAELSFTKGKTFRANQERDTSIREAQRARREVNDLKQSLQDAAEDEKKLELELQQLRQKEAEERAKVEVQTCARIEADKIITELNQERMRQEVEVQRLQGVISDLEASKARLRQDTEAAQDSLDKMRSTGQKIEGHLQDVLLHVQMRPC